jgi:hypothetical protein
MAVAAETWKIVQHDYPEIHNQAEHKKTAFLGSLALHAEVAITARENDSNDTTLLAALQLATLGDKPSDEVVETNVSSDVAERLYKAGHQTKVKLQYIDGWLTQNNRRLVNIHRNTLEHTVLIPEMHKRTTHELGNGFVFQELAAAGVFEEYNALVCSTSSTKLTQQEKKDYNFFTDTETSSLQLLRADDDDFTLETALVAGKKTPDSPRHDIPVLRQMAERHDAVIDTEDGTDFLQYIVLIPKAELPNGISDIVREYDDLAGGTFYGQAKPRQNYIEYAQFCEAREAAFAETVQNIKQHLLAEASTFKTPLEAVMRLDKLSERFCVTYAVHNDDVNEAVFGATAAVHIQEARFFIERGEYERAETSMHKAQQTAVSGSCPLFKGTDRGNPDAEGGQANNEESSGKEWMNCPFCTAKVFDDPCAKILKCWDCKAAVVNGRVVSKGDGGSKARAAAREAERKAHEAEMAKQVDDTFPEVDVAAIEAEEKARASSNAAQLALSGSGL